MRKLLPALTTHNSLIPVVTLVLSTVLLVQVFFRFASSKFPCLFPLLLDISCRAFLHIIYSQAPLFAPCKSLDDLFYLLGPSETVIYLDFLATFRPDVYHLNFASIAVLDIICKIYLICFFFLNTILSRFMVMTDKPILSNQQYCKNIC